MKKELKDYLHLYLGCQVKYLDEIWFMGAIHIFPEKPDNIIGVNIWKDGIVEQVQCLEIKPILRPLSNMTAEESKRWKTMVNSYQSYAATVKYFLDRHFDLFGLIQESLAIDKTKVN